MFRNVRNTSNSYETGDYASRQAMCHDLTHRKKRKAKENDNLKQNVVFSDEHVNKRDSRIWADDKPSVMQDGNERQPN